MFNSLVGAGILASTLSHQTASPIPDLLESGETTALVTVSTAAVLKSMISNDSRGKRKVQEEVTREDEYDSFGRSRDWMGAYLLESCIGGTVGLELGLRVGRT